MAKQTKNINPMLYFLAGIFITILILFAMQQFTDLQREPEDIADLLTTQTPVNSEGEATAPSPALDPILPTTTPVQSATPLFVPVNIESVIDEDMNQVGVLAFSMMDGLHQHIFIYHPQFFPLTRLTNSKWDEAYPAFSNDGKKLAYTSNQNGNWEVYILDLNTYSLTNVSNSSSYDSHPSWSPDDQWLVYESDRSGNLDLFIQSVTSLSEEAIQLTLNDADEYQPAWAPNGRVIAYTSLQSGNEDIWVADLDKVENRYTNISNQPETLDMYPFWSLDQNLVMWSTNQSMGQMIVSDSETASETNQQVTTGSFAVFHPQGKDLAVALHTNTGTNIGIFDPVDKTMKFPFQEMPGRVNGITWANLNLDLLLPLLNQSSSSVSPAEWLVELDSSDTIPQNRNGLVKIQSINAPYPFLHDTVDESFSSLHLASSMQLGWDFLATLNNAFVPITQPAPPMIEDYWLYSGRAFEIDDAPASANWLVTIREDIAGKTYWRIYLKPIDQSGAVGDKLHQRAWSFDLRTQGNPEAYEEGGTYTQSIPKGYWIDFTELAFQYGWTRIPALINWRTYYPGTQHTIFVHKDYLDLEAALLELYPPEALLPPASDSLVPPKPTRVVEEDE
jgi:TolB protein